MKGKVGLLQQKETIIFPPYCTIVHLSCGSWACVFPPPLSRSAICHLFSTPHPPPVLQHSLSAFLLFLVLLFPLTFHTFFFYDALRAAEGCGGTIPQWILFGLFLKDETRTRLGFCAQPAKIEMIILSFDPATFWYFNRFHWVPVCFNGLRGLLDFFYLLLLKVFGLSARIHRNSPSLRRSPCS